jgi:23S rRNA (uracil1939-C5)-methyltransferase
MPDLPKPNTVPICPFFYQCGGCETQDISYQDQVAYKSTWLQELFSPLASEVMWKDFLSSPQAFPIFFRNKIRFGFVKEEGKVFPSRHSKGSEEADIAVDTCFLQSPESVRIVQFTAKFAEDHNWTLYNPKTGTGWLKHLLIRQGKRTGETMLSLVTDAGTIPGEKAWIQQVTSEFPSVISLYQNSSWGRSNEHLEDRHLFGKTVIHEKIGDYNFQISPQAFFQTNSSMVEILYEAIKNTIPLSKNSHIWDLYAGSATIGIYLSQLVKEVLAIESNPSNIVDAQKNLELNNVRNVRIESGA